MIKSLLGFGVAFIAILAVASNSGCYQRTVAPELEYDQAQIDALDKEIKKLEWD